MSLLHFSDILEKAGLDPAKVKLIRHSLSDKDFHDCYYAEPQMVWEYTRIQKPGFSKGYDYWCVFVSGEGTTARPLTSTPQPRTFMRSVIMSLLKMRG